VTGVDLLLPALCSVTLGGLVALGVDLEGVSDVGAVAAQNGLVDACHQDVACKDLAALVLVR